MDNQSPGVFYFGDKVKQCSKCKEWKDFNEFSKSRSHGKPVLHLYCKKCVSEYDKQRRQTEEGKARSRAKMRKFYKTEAGKSARKRSSQKYRSVVENRVKQSIRRKLNKAIENGKFPHISTQKCNKCGSQAQHYHHYKGYDKEHVLDVMPVCAICHAKLEN